MKQFKAALGKMTDAEALEAFRSSKSVSDFCRRVWYGDKDPPGVAIKHAREVATAVGFDIEDYHGRRKDYKKNPSHCKECGEELSWEDHKAGKIFCDSSCSASYNNRRRAPRRKPEPKKVHELKQRGQEIFDLWASGERSEEFGSAGGRTKGELKRTLKRKIRPYLLEENDHKCMICGCSDEWNGQTLTFIIDHIDGDWTNHVKSNLRAICPNCNSLLKTTTSKERGTGRLSRRRDWQRFSESFGS
jgi:hypothetical protein